MANFSPLRLARQAQWRYWVHHPGQFMLTLLIIAVGVASAVGMDIAIEASQKSFLLSLAATNGRATHRIEANGGIPDDFFVQLRVKLGFREASPVVAGRLLLKPSHPAAAEHRSDQDLWGQGNDSESVQLLGLDPLIDTVHLGSIPFPLAANQATPVEQEAAQEGPVEALMRPGSVAMSALLARRLGLHQGDVVECVGGKKIKLATLFQSSGSGLENILICDIATAQELLGLQGKLSYIALRAPDGSSEADWETRLRSAVPERFTITSVGQRSYASLQLASSLFMNLKALSWLGAVVGMFLIYQAQSFCLLATRPQLAQMRRLGLTPQEAGWIVFQDGLWLGWLGSLLGCLGGVALSQFLVRMLSATLDDLYFSLQVQQVGVSALSLLKGFVLGLGTASLAVLPHAISVYLEPPAQLAIGSRMERATKRALGQFFWCGLVLIAVGTIGLTRDLALGTQLVALMFLVMGMSATIPYSVGWLNSQATRALQGRVPLWLSLGLRQVQSNMTRTGVAVAALSLALASLVSIETMVSSFRETLNEWLEQTLQADIYVALADRDGMREGTFMPQAFLKRLQEDGLTVATGARVGASPPAQGAWQDVTALIIRHLLVQFEFPQETQVAPQLLVALQSSNAQLNTYRLAQESAHPREDLREGQLWISQPFARRHHLKIGDHLGLATPAGHQNPAIAAIFIDFSTDQGYVLMDYNHFYNWFQDARITAFALRTKRPEAIPEIVERLRHIHGSDALEIRSNRNLKELSRTIFERTFQVTKALRWFALCIAVVGMSSSLTVLALQKRRERALLRALGMTVQEVSRVHLVHSLLLGFWAGLFAIGMGLIQAYAMVKVIQATAFGWTLAFYVPPSAWAAPWAAALCCCLAALVSLRSEQNVEIVSILREE